jgi:hypothetical protein
MDAAREQPCRVSQDDLMLQNLCGFLIQFVGQLVDSRGFILLYRRFVKQSTHRLGHEGIAVGGYVIDLRGEVVRKSDLNAHC